jgi:hypothetical protein
VVAAVAILVKVGGLLSIFNLKNKSIEKYIE